MIDLKIKLKTITDELTFVINDKELDRIEKRIAEFQAALKKQDGSITKLAADLGTQRHGVKPNEAKATEVEAKLEEAKSHKSLLVDDIASLTTFKVAFKKRLTNIAKEIEEEKAKKAAEANRAKLQAEIEADRVKFKAEIIANPDLLIDLILEEKKTDKNINYAKFLGKLKKRNKDIGNEKAD